MKAKIKSLVQRLAGVALEPLRRDLLREMEAARAQTAQQAQQDVLATISQASRVPQMILWQRYREWAAQERSPLTFADAGFRCHSQFEEDGILLYIFGLIGCTNHVAVEMCAGKGIECNCTNLVLNHGWDAYLFDGDVELVKWGREYFRQHPDCFLQPPRFTHAWITAENVNALMRGAGISGPVDLFSLDMDGVDYWIWDKLDAIDARVVVCETQNAIPADLSLTVPYDPAFVNKAPDFMGASLAAMTKLGRRKGYRLVGTHRHGFNAFFVKNGEGDALLPEVSVASCVNDLCSRTARAEVWPRIKDLGWVAV